MHQHKLLQEAFSPLLEQFLQLALKRSRDSNIGIDRVSVTINDVINQLSHVVINFLQTHHDVKGHFIWTASPVLLFDVDEMDPFLAIRVRI